MTSMAVRLEKSLDVRRRRDNGIAEIRTPGAQRLRQKRQDDMLFQIGLRVFGHSEVSIDTSTPCVTGR
jgi:hypothetical protein